MNPWSIGFAPDLQRALKSVLMPMAASAATMRNLLTDLSAAARLAGMRPRLVRPDMAKKPRMNHGKTDFMLTLTLAPSADASFFLSRRLMAAKTRTVGMIARVLVSLTMVAKSPAASLNAYPVATTLEVSLTAVPAQRPNAASESPSFRPRIGKTTTITISKRNVADNP